MKIVIADDHDLVRDALATLLERDDPECMVLHASDFQQAFTLVKEQSDVDIILLDVYMPGMDGLNSVESITRQFSDLKVVLMSGHAQQKDISKGFDLGAHGFVSKSMNGSALISVLKLVLSGVKYVPELVLTDTEENLPLESGISKREQEVLLELSQGFSNKVIARNLGVQETTIKLHLRSLFKKLQASNRTEAVINARNSRLIGSQ